MHLYDAVHSRSEKSRGLGTRMDARITIRISGFKSEHEISRQQLHVFCVNLIFIMKLQVINCAFVDFSVSFS